MTRSMHRVFPGFLGLICAAALLGASAAHAAPYEVRQGDTLKTVASTFNLSVKQLAAANGLSPAAHLKAGAILEIPGGSTLPRPDITEPGGNLKALTGPASSGYAHIPAATPRPQPEARPLPVNPEFRSAVDAVTPSEQITREPKTYNRAAPGVSAVLHQDAKTEIKGVFSLPGGNAKGASQGGQEAGSSPSAGVLLRRSF